MPHSRFLTRSLMLVLALATTPVLAVDITVDVLGDPVPDGCTAGSCSTARCSPTLPPNQAWRTGR